MMMVSAVAFKNDANIHMYSGLGCFTGLEINLAVHSFLFLGTRDQ